MNNLGERLYNLRAAHEMSQGDLAEKLDVSRQTISKWENNMSIPELDKIVAISNLFGVSVDYIVKGDGEAPTITPTQTIKIDSEPAPVRMITIDPNKKLIRGLALGLGIVYLITLLINTGSLVSSLFTGLNISHVITMFLEMLLGYIVCVGLFTGKLQIVAVSYILMAAKLLVFPAVNSGFNFAVIVTIIPYILIALSYFIGNKKNSKALFALSIAAYIAVLVLRCINSVNSMSQLGWDTGSIISSVISANIGSVPYYIVHIGVALLMYFRANPKPTYEVPENEIPQHNDMYVSMIKYVLLTIFTLGIYDCYWVYKTTENLNCNGVNEVHSGAKKLLLCIFVPFYRIYWFYAQSKRLENLMRKKDMHTSSFATVTLILAIFVPIVAAGALLQSKINEYAEN